MTREADIPSRTEPQLVVMAELVAWMLRAGDLVTLSGDLGAGKSTFARALIRALLDDDAAEVPSPTFSLLQSYATPRFPVAHADLYRLANPSELDELGLDEALATGACVVEWPEQAGGALADPSLAIRIEDGDRPETRSLTLCAGPAFAGRLERLRAILRFLDARPGVSTVRYLQGDASPRGYARLKLDGRSVILMDSPRRPDGPPVKDGLPYSRIAHLAEDVRPFVAVGTLLRNAGLAAPEMIAADLDQGLLLIEDFGDGVYGRMLADGASQAELWRAAVAVLSDARQIDVTAEIPLPDGSFHRIPHYDPRALIAETELLLDWLWPLMKGEAASEPVRQSFLVAWQPIIARLADLPAGLVLRDYHSPNLMWLPDRPQGRQVGLLDFQDAVAGPVAYDLVSLLQDARLDVPRELEQDLKAFYAAEAAARDPGFDPDVHEFAYAALGAQRNTKILGIFARLALRDGKDGYLAHIPRIWGYLERNLPHPALAQVTAWFHQHWPDTLRVRPHINRQGKR